MLEIVIIISIPLTKISLYFLDTISLVFFWNEKLLKGRTFFSKTSFVNVAKHKNPIMKKIFSDIIFS